jgi:hypothetical protein
MQVTQEPRAFCLSKSKKNMEAWDIIESYALQWGVPNAQAIFRMAREYNQMKRWSVYNTEGMQR